MKSQDILAGMLKEFGTPVGLYSERDVETLRSRIAHEGEQFITIALPQLDDLLLEGLSTGRLPVVTGWATKRNQRLPLFLYGHWKAVFDSDGSLLSTPSFHSVRAIRQISRAHKKVFEVCSDSNVQAAVKRFLAIDAELSQLRIPRFVETLSTIAHYLFGEVVGEAVSGDMPYKHGPGGVAERYDSLYRWDFPVVSREASELVGIEVFRPTWSELLEDPPRIEMVPARLAAVPKTAVKPRLITIEPTYNQFLQQGLATKLRDGMSRFPVCNITDQMRNRRLAQSSSISQQLATVDLSDASDRISNGLVRMVFGWNKSFMDFIQGTRSQVVELPDGSLVQQNKFAGMGSAITFPLETMLFTAIVVYTMCESDRDFSRANVRSYLTREDIGVYGDDIVIPVAVCPTLIRHLEECGLAVNTAKSFSSGGFRESCGGDYLDGRDVTPVYVRRNLPQSKHDVTELVSISSFRNQWVARYGYGVVSSLLDAAIAALIPYPPAKAEDHATVDNGVVSVSGYQGICRVGPDDQPEGRWSQTMFRREVKMMVPVSLRKQTRWTDRGALFKTLYGGFNRDDRHLTHHGRAVSAKLKHRWIGVG